MLRIYDAKDFGLTPPTFGMGLVTAAGRSPDFRFSETATPVRQTQRKP